MTCFNCVHRKLCFNLIGGMNLQMKAENCEDFLEINKDIWIAPCKRDDTVYVIDGLEVYPASVLCIEASLLPNDDISWTLKISFEDEFETLHYLWGTWGYQIFRTKDEAEKELIERKIKLKWSYSF